MKRVQGELGMHCQIRVKRHSRRKEHEQHVLENVLSQNFEAEGPNQVWLADSTEVRYGMRGDHKLRLSGVLDIYGRRLLAYNLSLTETTLAEIQVFERAFEATGNVHPIVHTDRGSAYTSNLFNEFMESHQVIRSMSRPGTPYDNAPMERWWNEFKLRWLERHPMAKTYNELVRLIEEGIEYFNHSNRSVKRNGLTPDEYWGVAI